MGISIVSPGMSSPSVCAPGFRGDSGTHRIAQQPQPFSIPANDNDPPHFFRVATINASLFGRLAQKGKKNEPTPLYMKDFERLPGEHGIIHYLRQNAFDFVALQEVWDPGIQRDLMSELRDVYPYMRITPWEAGIAAAIQHVGKKLGIQREEIEDISDEIMEKLAQVHYQTTTPLFSILSKIITEDRAARVLKQLFNTPHLFGAGLMVLSKHPFLDWDTGFTPFQHHADLDHFTRKGVMKSCVFLPGLGPVNFLVTHLQEGTSKRARLMRSHQIHMMRDMINTSDFPIVALGDLNITREEINPEDANLNPTLEYQEMLAILNLKDGYRGIHRHPNSFPGDTYHDGPYARQKGISPYTSEYAMTLDYVLHDRNFEPVSAIVDRDGFYNLDLGIDNSDHSPLIVTLRRRDYRQQWATG